MLSSMPADRLHKLSRQCGQYLQISLSNASTLNVNCREQANALMQLQSTGSDGPSPGRRQAGGPTPSSLSTDIAVPPMSFR